MPESMTINVRDVARLAEEHGVRDLADRLHQARVPTFLDDGRELVPERQWLAFVGDALRSYSPRGAETREVPAQPTPQAGRSWGAHRQQQLDRNPYLAPLLEDFTQFIQERVPGVVVQQHPWTRTFIAPDGRRVGLKLRATRGLYLYSHRRGQELKAYVRTPDDFERALHQLLPGIAAR